MTNERHFPKTLYKWEFDYGLFTNLPRTIVPHDFSPSSFKLKRGILPLLTKYVSLKNNLKITCHTKLKFFLWTKLLENFLLAKYFISATAPLKNDLNTYVMFHQNSFVAAACKTIWLLKVANFVRKWSAYNDMQTQLSVLFHQSHHLGCMNLDCRGTFLTFIGE